MTNYRSQLNKLLADYSHSRRLVKEEKQRLTQAKDHLKNALEGQRLVQQIAEKVQQYAHRQLASVVTKCLQSVFGEQEAYEFLIQFAQKRGKTEAALCFAKDGQLFDNPKREVGGGCIDVAALALRLACLVLAKPQKRKLLIMDEPYRGLNGEENRKRMGKLLLTLSKEMQVQIIMSSGNDWMKVGKVINLEEE